MCGLTCARNRSLRTKPILFAFDTQLDVFLCERVILLRDKERARVCVQRWSFAGFEKNVRESMKFE